MSNVIFLHPDTPRGLTYCYYCTRRVRLEEAFMVSDGKRSFCPNCLDAFLDYVFQTIVLSTPDSLRGKPATAA